MSRAGDNSELAEEAATFAAAMTPCEERWSYAFKAASHQRVFTGGRRVLHLNGKAFPPLRRFLGVGTIADFGLRRLLQTGGDVGAARVALASKPWFRGHDPFTVGPMEAWQVGHVYFARIVNAPHVVKVGFSRRVRDRIEDIESKNKVRLEVFATKVGTLADEHWWHHDWRSLRIAGEWFYAPKSTDRALPAFLSQPQRQAA